MSHIVNDQYFEREIEDFGALLEDKYGIFSFNELVLSDDGEVGYVYTYESDHSDVYEVSEKFKALDKEDQDKALELKIV